MQEKDKINLKKGINNGTFIAKQTNLKDKKTDIDGNIKFKNVDKDYSDLYRYNEKMDIPNKVIDTYFDEQLYFKLEFKERKNGIVADETILSSKFLKKKHPEFLVEFYELVILKSLKKN